jgi:hypothetical protein
MVLSNANLGDTSSASEEVSDSVLVSAETHVANKESAGFFRSGSGFTARVSSVLTAELNLDLTASVGGVVLGVDGLLGVLLVLVLDESDSAGASASHDKLALGHVSVLAEDALKGILVNVVGKGLDEDLALALRFGVRVSGLLVLGIVVVVGVGIVDGLVVAVAGVGTAAASAGLLFARVVVTHDNYLVVFIYL